MDYKDQIRAVLDQLLPHNPEKRDAILTQVAGKNADYQRQLLAVLKSEQSKSFFDENHYTSTAQEIHFFDFPRSEEFSAILGIIFPKIDFYGQLEKRDTHITKNSSSEQIQEALQKEGYFVFPEKLPLSVVESMKEGLRSCAFTLKQSHKLFQIRSADDLENINDNTGWIFDQQDVLRIEEVQKLIMDPVLLNTIQDFLGCPPIHVQANSWWSKPELADSSSLNRNAQMFHQDKEFIKFLKIFIYLNDVNDDNGPHQYIAGSNKDYTDHVPKDYHVSDRLSDDYLSSVYPPERIKSLKGATGTVIIEDTSGFHKGKPLTSGYRQMLQLEFVSSLYFNPVPCFTSENLSVEYQNFLKSNPRLALNYNDAKYKKDLAKSHSERKKYLVKNTKIKIHNFIKRFYKKSPAVEPPSGMSGSMK